MASQQQLNFADANARDTQEQILLGFLDETDTKIQQQKVREDPELANELKGEINGQSTTEKKSEAVNENNVPEITEEMLV